MFVNRWERKDYKVRLGKKKGGAEQKGRHERGAREGHAERGHRQKNDTGWGTAEEKAQDGAERKRCPRNRKRAKEKGRFV